MSLSQIYALAPALSGEQRGSDLAWGLPYCCEDTQGDIHHRLLLASPQPPFPLPGCRSRRPQETSPEVSEWQQHRSPT